jgi:3',5'-cyclic AMP phosphodiesterase CpdA
MTDTPVRRSQVPQSSLMFTLAHLTDLHLGPLPQAGSWRDYLGKRTIGAISWHRRRRFLHIPAVSLAMTGDIRASAPDHVALTGDLVNIALPAEFVAAAKWLKDFGPSDWITVVPGNHDAYVHFPWENGAGLWADYMLGDMNLKGARQQGNIAAVFPFVRQRKNIALIGVSSAVPQAWHRAGGRLGHVQLDHLASTLSELRQRGYYRVLLIHHPPVPGLTPHRRALEDAAELKTVLEEEGAELVLHGHNHHHSHVTLASRHGPVNIFGLPSASTPIKRSDDPAAWSLYRIRRQDGAWRTSVTTRSWDNDAAKFVEQSQFDL